MSWQSGIQSLVSLYFNCGSKEGYWHIATTLKVRRDKYLLRVRQLNDEWCPVTITVTSNKHLDVVHPRDHVFGIIYCGIMYDNLSVKDISRDGLVGYDAGFTHLRSRVQFPVLVLSFSYVFTGSISDRCEGKITHHFLTPTSHTSTHCYMINLILAKL